MATVIADPIEEARRDAFEFGTDLANHLPMVLWAMRRLGGSERDFERFTSSYKAANPIAPVRASPGGIVADNWNDHLGERAYEAAYRRFFDQELSRLGDKALMDAYLPILAPGIAASALHAFMRLAYAFDSESSGELAKALAYWATTYLALGQGVGQAARTDDPGAILGMIAEEPAFRGIEPSRDLLWEFMLAMAEKTEFLPVYDWLSVDQATIPKMAAASLRLYAAAMDFSSLHAVTGTHWLRLVITRTGPSPVLIKSYWQAIASLYPKIGFVPPLNDDEANDLRNKPCPDWPEIERTALNATDEHDVSLTYTAREEFQTYGDRLYQIVAARRLGLID